MAIIKCIECGNNISDKAQVCVHCGCPIEESLEAYMENTILSSKNIQNMAEYITDGILWIPDYIKCIEEKVEWYELYKKKRFMAIYVPESVKELKPKSFRYIPQNVAIYFLTETEDYDCGDFFKIKNSTPVFINYSTFPADISK